MIEYPHCPNCTENRRCRNKGFSEYKAHFVEFVEQCKECPFDFHCTQECIDYAELVEYDIEYVKENYINERCHRRYKND